MFRSLTLAQLINLIIGPLLWLGVMFATPLGGDLTARGGLGMIAWAAWYWGTGCVKPGWTVFVPLIGAGFLPGMDWGVVTQSFMHPALAVLLGPALLVTMCSRWGLTRRVALWVMSRVGGQVRTQAVAWLVMATCMSFLAANVVIAIALTPVAVELLQTQGYKTAEQRTQHEPILIILAVAIGASLGGFMTPLAGGQAVITWDVMGQTLGGEVALVSWLSRMALPVGLTLAATAALFYWVFCPKDSILGGSREEARNKLEKMGPLSRTEQWSLFLFGAAVVVLFTRPLWDGWLQVSAAQLFTLMVLMALIIPAPDDGAGRQGREPGERLMSQATFQQFPFHGFALWPIAMSISLLVEQTGASGLMSQYLGSYWDRPAFWGVGALVLFAVLLAQPASDTGAAGMLAATIAGATAAAGVDPVPWLFIMGFTVNFSFLIPTATGTMAIPLALEGRTTRYLPLYGAVVAAVCALIAWGFWGTVMWLDLEWWQSIGQVM